MSDSIETIWWSIDTGCPFRSFDNCLTLLESYHHLQELKERAFDDMQAICKSCSFNPNIDEPAGCVGLCHFPFDDSIEDNIQRVIRKYNVDIAKYFPLTSPQWYGFWIRPAKGDSILHLLRFLKEILKEVGEDSLIYKYVSPLIAGLQRAYQTDCSVSFYLSPPGHAGLGAVTTFKHCPRCKAETDEERRWQDYQYPEEFRCRVCGNIYNPNLTGAVEEF